MLGLGLIFEMSIARRFKIVTPLETDTKMTRSKRTLQVFETLIKTLISKTKNFGLFKAK